MSQHSIIISLAALCGLSLAAAQPEVPAGSRPERPVRRPASPLLHTLDANKDGSLSADEIANASKALAALDRNADGQLTAEELHPPLPAADESRGHGGRRSVERTGPRPERAPADERRARPAAGIPHRPPHPFPPVIAALDVDRDRILSAGEMARAAEALRGLDKDNDGQLSSQEWLPRQGGPPHAPPHPEGPPPPPRE